MVRRPSAYGHPFGQPITQVVVDSLADDALRIAGEDARHLTKSLRLQSGDKFVATDGKGTVARLEARALDRDGIDARVCERAVVPPPRLRLWVVAEAEGARGDWIVEKAVELGAFGFRALAGAAGGRLERWRRLAHAALKQSLGAHALDLGDGGPAIESAHARALRSEGGEPFAVWLAEAGAEGPLARPIPRSGDLFLVTGPPGGLAEATRAQWESLPGVRAVGLGPLRLRAETAAVALLAAARLASLDPSANPETA